MHASVRYVMYCSHSPISPIVWKASVLTRTWEGQRKLVLQDGGLQITVLSWRVCEKLTLLRVVGAC